MPVDYPGQYYDVRIPHAHPFAFAILTITSCIQSHLPKTLVELPPTLRFCKMTLEDISRIISSEIGSILTKRSRWMASQERVSETVEFSMESLQLFQLAASKRSQNVFFCQVYNAWYFSLLVHQFSPNVSRTRESVFA